MLTSLSEHWRVHVKARNASADRATFGCGAKERTVRGAFGFDHVVGIVAEALSGFQARKLADDAIAFNHESIAIGVTHDPFAPEDVHRFLRIVVDGDVIDKRMGPVWGGGTRGVILDLIHRDR